MIKNKTKKNFNVQALDRNQKVIFTNKNLFKYLFLQYFSLMLYLLL